MINVVKKSNMWRSEGREVRCSVPALNAMEAESAKQDIEYEKSETTGVVSLCIFNLILTSSELQFLIHFYFVIVSFNIHPCKILG